MPWVMIRSMIQVATNWRIVFQRLESWPWMYVPDGRDALLLHVPDEAPDAGELVDHAADLVDPFLADALGQLLPQALLGDAEDLHQQVERTLQSQLGRRFDAGPAQAPEQPAHEAVEQVVPDPSKKPGEPLLDRRHHVEQEADRVLADVLVGLHGVGDDADDHLGREVHQREDAAGRSRSGPRARTRTAAGSARRTGPGCVRRRRSGSTRSSMLSPSQMPRNSPVTISQEMPSSDIAPSMLAAAWPMTPVSASWS